MIRKILLSTVFAATASASLAADLPARAPAPFIAPAPLFTWTGFYVGLNAGGAWGNSSFASTPLPTAAAFGANPFSQKLSPSGGIGGAQIGYNWQMGSLVFGLEADIQASGLKATSVLFGLPTSTGVIIPAWNQVATASLDWFGTVRGRLGFAFDRALIYATGGLIYGNVKTSSITTYTAAPPFTYAGASSSTRTGWTLGGGVEYAFTNNWSAKIEGLYFDLGRKGYVATPLAANPPFTVGQSVKFTGGIFRVGLNYKF